MMKKITVIILACVLVLGSFAGGIFVGVIGSSAAGAQDNRITVSQQQYDLLTQYGKLEGTRETIAQSYYADYDDQMLSEYAVKGMVAALGDPYSAYYTAEEYRQRLESDAGNYVGIGVQVSLDDDSICTVTTVFENSPAMEAGILPGDKIVGVAGYDVRGQSLNDVVDQIKGESGTDVQIILRRGEETLELTVARAEVVASHVSYRMLDDEIGYIEITGFTGDDVTGFTQAIAFLQSSGAKALVLDLRYNGGGYVDDAAQIADVLLPEGKIYTLENKNGDTTGSADSDKRCLGLPLAVLVNGYSASASEIVAGAIQDYGAGVLIGTQTFGKGIVQSPFMFKDGSVLMLTTEYYLTPNGRKIHGDGLAPDIEVELDASLNPYLISDEEDAQLQAAMNHLHDQLND
jgi:carboxyl-terminal processing protease